MSDIVLGSHQKIKNGVSQQAFVYTRPPIALNMQEQQCGLEFGEGDRSSESETNEGCEKKIGECASFVSGNFMKIWICGSILN